MQNIKRTFGQGAYSLELTERMTSKPTANPSGLLTLKKMYEKGMMTYDEYLKERMKTLNTNVYKLGVSR